ncbi:MAG: DUF4476 domain-containing protein [Fimbriimonadaceae bacterium]|nr:DUF4476 domain-containing protein [Chitinophagales bacterium]
MKNSLPKIICALIMNAQSLFAYASGTDYKDFSSLEIKSYGAGYFTVSIDRQYFQNPVKNFLLSNIEPGDHKIEIFTERAVHHGYYTSTQQVKLFSGIIYLKPASLIQGIIDEHGRFYIDDIDPLTHYEYYHDEYYQPDYHQQPVYAKPYAMNDRAFLQLVNVLEDQWFDDTRLDVAIQALQNSWLTSAQVKEILQLFWFEDSKLSFAKAAYKKVVDPQSYFVIYKEFWFSSSVDDLNDYISSYR